VEGNNTFGQEEFMTDVLRVELADKIEVTFGENKVLVTDDEKLNGMILKYGIYEIIQVFPYSKIEKLQRVYRIRFTGNIDNLIEDLKKVERVRHIEKCYRVQQNGLYDPSDHMLSLTIQNPNEWLWHLKKIQADKAWDITKGDRRVKVALIDNGFDLNHPDLKNKVTPRYDPYVSKEFFVPCSNGSDGIDHGTTVASFIAAETDGGGQLAAIGFNCMMIWYSTQFINYGNEYIERAHHAAMVMHADVLTTSVGMLCRPEINEYDRLALKEILDKGTIVVVPAGNGPSNQCTSIDGRVQSWKPLSPDYDERVIVVSSTGIDDKHQYVDGGVDKTHSHYPEVDICAPGYCIMGATCTKNLDITTNTCVDNTWPYYGCCTGTSFATPIVAGVCALMKSVNLCITPAQAQAIIKSTADPIADASNYPGLVGAGRINAYKAVYQATLTGTVNVGGSITRNVMYTAPYSVVCTASITNKAVVTLEARQSIVLNPGFSVSEGCTLIINADNQLPLSCQ
jgi:subtilisin family serine protease